MHVLFVAPNFPSNQREFVRALKSVGAVVTGIGDTRVEHLDDQVKGWLDFYEHVPSLADEDAVTEAVRRAQRRGPWVDRLEATIESHVLMAARVRERTGIPGMSSETVLLCRDKFRMKQFLRARGIPCAKNAAVSSAAEARAFAQEAGYPLILKPRDGAGAVNTYRLDSDEDLLRAIAETGLDRRPLPMTMEEFIAGHEGFYDTLTCNGQVVFEGVCHYYPNVLEAMRTRWISPQIVVTNRIDAPGYAMLKDFGRRVVATLGLSTTPTHMEWFYGARGLTFSEIGARPPGCRMWDLYNYANEFDLYRAWAEAIVLGRTSPAPSRRYSAGAIALRPSQDGHIKGYLGVEEVQAKYGSWIVRAHLPPPGTPTQPVEAGYLANAWVWVRHPDYDGCRAMLDEIGQTLKVVAG